MFCLRFGLEMLKNCKKSKKNKNVFLEKQYFFDHLPPCGFVNFINVW